MLGLGVILGVLCLGFLGVLVYRAYEQRSDKLKSLEQRVANLETQAFLDKGNGVDKQ